MKQKISTLLQGTAFHYGGERFVVLDKLESGVLVLLEQSSKSVPFNSRYGCEDFPKNYYAHSALRAEIEGPWLESLIEHGAKRDDMVPFDVDLRPTDISGEHCTLSALAAPLTLWQYCNYKDIIPFNKEDWWWLVTPWSSPWVPPTDTVLTSSVWTVCTIGHCDGSGCSSRCGLRPSLILNSELLVSLDREEDADGDCDNRSVDLIGVDTLTPIRNIERRAEETIRLEATEVCGEGDTGG